MFKRFFLRGIAVAALLSCGAYNAQFADEDGDETKIVLKSLAYDVSDLLPHDGAGGGDRAGCLAGLIRSLVAPVTWDNCGATGTITVKSRGQRRELVVNQTPDVHREIADLMRQLRRAKAGKMPADSRSEAEKRIEDALNSPTSFELVETPLADVIDYLKDYHKIDIFLAKDALDESGVETNTPVTKHLKGISLRSALNLTLRELGLTYVVRNGLLLITTPETAEQNVSLRVYPISAVLAKADKTPDGLDAKRLLGLLTRFVEPTTWDEVGGPAACSIWPPEAPWALVVSQGRDAHRETNDLIDVLRFAAVPPTTGAWRLPPAEEKVWEALNEKVDAEFVEQPLRHVCDYFEDFLDINIELDKRPLEAANVPSDHPVTSEIKDKPFRSVLRSILGPLKLSYVVENEVLLITKEDRTVRTAFYRLDEQTLRRVTGDARENSADALVQKIVKSIAPGTWSDSRAVGQIETVSIGRNRLLIIQHSHRVHEQIAELLGQPGIRRLYVAPPKAAAAPAGR